MKSFDTTKADSALIVRIADRANREFAGEPPAVLLRAVTLPTVHLNGTGRTTLQSTYADAAHDLNKFIRSWSNTEFNARDYVVAGAWDKAVAQREAMNDKIREIRDYLNTIREHLDSTP